MTSINLVFRCSSRAGRHPGSLFFRLIRHRRSKSVTLSDCRLYPEEWDKKGQSVILPSNDSRRSAYLEKLQTRILAETDILHGCLLRLENEGYYNVDELGALYMSGKSEGLLQSYAEKLAVGLEKRGQVRTAAAYRTVVRGLVCYNNGCDIPLSQVSAGLIRGFESHLRDKGRMPNTISYYMRNLRAIYNKAVAEKVIAGRRGEHPFSGVYTGVTRTMKRSLSLHEVQSLCNFDFEALLENERPDSARYKYLGRLESARSYFSFCFYSRGMCFIDLAYLGKENIHGGILRYTRRKTGQQIEVKVTGEMQRIIDRFAAQVKGSRYLFPLIREGGKNTRLQYETALRGQNERIKQLARMAGIPKPLSTHWARHSWATIAKQKNVPLRVICECLGHTSEKTTLIYLDSLDHSVLDAANELITSAVTGGCAAPGIRVCHKRFMSYR